MVLAGFAYGTMVHKEIGLVRTNLNHEFPILGSRVWQVAKHEENQTERKEKGPDSELHGDLLLLRLPQFIYLWHLSELPVVAGGTLEYKNVKVSVVL